MKLKRNVGLCSRGSGDKKALVKVEICSAQTGVKLRRKVEF